VLRFSQQARRFGKRPLACCARIHNRRCLS
jgi:hypothetical protein